MSYADLIVHSPKSNRASNDRIFISSSSSASSSQLSSFAQKSRTPDRKCLKNSSLNKFSKRCLSSSRLFYNSNSMNSSNDLLSPTSSRNERRSQLSLSNSGSSTTSLLYKNCNASPTHDLNKRLYPKKPIIKFPIESDLIPTDFYISPIDWSKKDAILVILNNGKVKVFNPKLNSDKDISNNTVVDSVSVVVNNHFDGRKAAIGCDDGHLDLFDISTETIEGQFDLFDSTVMVSDWNSSNLVISGGREGFFSLLDARTSNYSRYNNFFSEDICGIKFNTINPNIFAVSSNDSSVKIFDLRNLESSISRYTEHNSAVKALAFSPIDENVIITGGGTLDKTIRMWNIFNCETYRTINTNSQVCNLYWNKDYNEIISTHGFSQNHIAIWKGNDLSLIRQYFENYNRVLYMTHSYDETKIATLIPSEGIDIWNFFPEQRLSLMSTISELR
ncbi:hypothetical protein M9Y10_026835 [Tritrichomonas musculus]|uniref:CDC20/Fizzy WD40 domain-containing protein n=1 Tax=Tritrichomonas musculus TaxID=1915356 RepID=A0ABR2H6N5_9EUKA